MSWGVVSGHVTPKTHFLLTCQSGFKYGTCMRKMWRNITLLDYRLEYLYFSFFLFISCNLWLLWDSLMCWIIFCSFQTDHLKAKRVRQTPAFLKPAAAVSVRDPTQAGGRENWVRFLTAIRYEICLASQGWVFDIFVQCTGSRGTWLSQHAGRSEVGSAFNSQAVASCLLHFTGPVESYNILCLGPLLGSWR